MIWRAKGHGLPFELKVTILRVQFGQRTRKNMLASALNLIGPRGDNYSVKGLPRNNALLYFNHGFSSSSIRTSHSCWLPVPEVVRVRSRLHRPDFYHGYRSMDHLICKQSKGGWRAGVSECSPFCSTLRGRLYMHFVLTINVVSF